MAQGSTLAFMALFDKYWLPLVRNACKVLKRKEVAHNLVCDVFADLWSKRASLVVEHVASYLHTAVKCRVIRYIQQERIPLCELDFVGDFETAQPVEAVLNFHEIDTLLKRAVTALPTPCRLVFTMSRFDYLSNTEIARKLSLPLNTVEHHLAQAIGLLRPALRNAFLLFVLWSGAVFF